VTPFHAKFWAYELTRRAPADSVDRLATALVDAQVDLNPHQVDAALFAFKSPLSKNVLLADEVGLGKTIEAGLPLHITGQGPKKAQKAQKAQKEGPVSATPVRQHNSILAASEKRLLV